MGAFGKKKVRTSGATRAVRSCKSGAAAIEFALVVPPFLALMFGVVEYARYVWTIEAVQETATAGARCYGLSLDNCSSVTSATTYMISEALNWELTLTAANIQILTATTCNNVPNTSQIQVTYTFQSVVPALITPLANAVITGSACSG